MSTGTRVPVTVVCKRMKSQMRGFTLIELMVASALSLAVIAGALLVFTNSQQSYRTQSLTRQIQENGRFALQTMAEDLRMVKYFGLNMIPENIKIDQDELDFVRCGESGWASDIVEPIFASNNVNPYAASCIPASNYKANTDVLVVRHVDSEPIPTSNIRKDNLYLYTSLKTGGIFRADNNEAIDVTDGIDVVGVELPVSTYKVSANAYYVRPCSDAGGNSACGDVEDDTIPTLVRETLTKNGTTTEALVEYVENMQVLFGIDTASDFTIDRYVNADNITDWSKVIAVRIYILVRAPKAVRSYDNDNTYVVGDDNVTPGDHYYRKLFAETLFLRNPSIDTSI